MERLNPHDRIELVKYAIRFNLSSQSLRRTFQCHQVNLNALAHLIQSTPGSPEQLRGNAGNGQIDVRVRVKPGPMGEGTKHNDAYSAELLLKQAGCLFGNAPCHFTPPGCLTKPARFPCPSSSLVCFKLLWWYHSLEAGELPEPQRSRISQRYGQAIMEKLNPRDHVKLVEYAIHRGLIEP